MKVLFIVLSFFHAGGAWAKNDVIKLKVGFVSKVQCDGRLFISAIGNDALVRIEALPKELGCAVILKPTGGAGTTNLILETSTGTIEKVVLISAN